MSGPRDLPNAKSVPRKCEYCGSLHDMQVEESKHGSVVSFCMNPVCIYKRACKKRDTLIAKRTKR
jgi:hypothetical protein